MGTRVDSNSAHADEVAIAMAGSRCRFSKFRWESFALPATHRSPCCLHTQYAPPVNTLSHHFISSCAAYHDS